MKKSGFSFFVPLWFLFFFFFQSVKVKVLVAQSRPAFCDPMDYTSVHGILQAIILEWVAIPFSRGSSPLRDWIPGILHYRQILYHQSHMGLLLEYRWFKMLRLFHNLTVMMAAVAAAKSLQSCPTLCDPIDGSPSGSSVPGILQARTLEWWWLPLVKIHRNRQKRESSVTWTPRGFAQRWPGIWREGRQGGARGGSGGRGGEPHRGGRQPVPEARLWGFANGYFSYQSLAPPAKPRPRALEQTGGALASSGFPASTHLVLELPPGCWPRTGFAQVSPWGPEGAQRTWVWS